MIISTSTNNLKMDLVTLRIANQYGEKRSVLGKACMDDFHGDARLTFVVHDGFTQDSKQFVANLLSYCPHNKLPETLKKIDFILMGESQQFTRFTKKVFAILSKDYPDLEVNIFITSKLFYGKDIRRILDHNNV